MDNLQNHTNTNKYPTRTSMKFYYEFIASSAEVAQDEIKERLDQALNNIFQQVRDDENGEEEVVV